MKPETLDGLLIDRELGELPPDVIELLDSYLELAPPARGQAEVMTRTVQTARETMRRFPELVYGTGVESGASVFSLARWLAPWMSRAAVITAATLIGTWVGYRAGMSSIPVESAEAIHRRGSESIKTEHRGVERKDLWARYNVAFDRQHGTFTISKQP